jgi:hypothetical protein
MREPFIPTRPLLRFSFQPLSDHTPIMKRAVRHIAQYKRVFVSHVTSTNIITNVQSSNPTTSIEHYAGIDKLLRSLFFSTITLFL